jgi:tetratricopeptide (TPR) repeat protein
MVLPDTPHSLLKSLRNGAVVVAGMMCCCGMVFAMENSLAPVERSMARADALYWFALADGGDMRMLGLALASLDEAEESLARMPESEQSNRSREKIEALRRELLEQQEMAHDTIHGTLPLLRYFLGNDSLSEWVDDPWVIAAVRGARSLSEQSGHHWTAQPQLDIFFSSQVFHGGDYEDFAGELRPFAALENEMAFIFNQDARFFNHHRAELVAALSAKLLARLDAEGADADIAQTLAAAWGLDRLVEVRIRELFVEKPWWFYQLSARLFTAEGSLDGSVSAFGMVRDLREELPWMILAFLLPPLLGTGLVAAQRAPVGIFLVAYGFFLAVVLGLLAFLRPWLPSGDMLLVLYWWGVAALAILLLGLLPAGVVLLLQRMGQTGRRILEGNFFVVATWGAAAAMGSLVGYAATIALPLEQALLLAVLSPPALAYPIRQSLAFARGKSNEGTDRVEHGLAGLVTGLIFAYLLFTLPDDSRSITVVGQLAIATLLAMAATAVVFFSHSQPARPAAISILLLTAVSGFGALLTGNVILASLFTLPTLWAIGRDVFSKFAASEKNSAGASRPEDWASILGKPNYMDLWPFTETGSFGQIQEVLEGFAGETSRTDDFEILLVTGEAGIGKTRAITEAAKRAKLMPMRGICQAGDPYASFAEAFQDPKLFRQVSSDSICLKLAELLPVVGTLCNLFDSDESEVALDPKEIAAGVMELWSHRAASQEAAFLWIDDGENLRADGDGLRVLLALREIAIAMKLENQASRMKHPLLLVISGRYLPEPLLKLHGARTIKMTWGPPERLSFWQGCMTEQEAQKMQDLLGDFSPAIAVLWLRELWQKQAIESVDGRLKPRHSEVLNHIPKTVVEAAGETVRALRPEILAVLEAAACDGNKFHIRAVAAAVERNLGTVLELLQEAEREGIVIDLPEDEIYGFRLSVVREYFLRKLERPAVGESAPATDQKRYAQRYHSLQRGLAEFYRSCPEDSSRIEAAHHALEAGTGYANEAVTLSAAATPLCLQTGRWHEAEKFALVVLQSPGASAESKIRVAASYLRALWSSRSPLPESMRQSVEKLLSHAQPGSPLVLPAVALLCEMTRFVGNNDGQSLENLVRKLDQLATSEERAAWDRHPALVLCVEHLRAWGRYKLYSKSTKEAPTAKTESLREAMGILRTALDETSAGFSNAPLGISRELFQEYGEALNSFGEILINLKQIEGASSSILPSDIETPLRQSIEIKTQIGDKLGLAISYGTLGRYFLFKTDPTQEELEKAKEAFTQDYEISKEIGDVVGMVKMPSFLGAVYYKLGDFEAAKEQYDKSAKLARELGSNFLFDLAMALCGQLETCLACGDTTCLPFEAAWSELRQIKADKSASLPAFAHQRIQEIEKLLKKNTL